MKQIRRHLSYANVMSSIAVFVVLGGAAVAAIDLPRNSVGSKQLKRKAVKTSKIAKEAVKAAKIANGAIGTDKLADLGVTTGKLANDAVSTDKLAADAVTTAKIAKDAVTTEKIAKDAVTAEKIAKDAVTTEKIANDAVTGNKVKESTLGQVPSAANANSLGGIAAAGYARRLFARVQYNDATPSLIASSPGIVPSGEGALGFPRLTFPQSMEACAIVVSANSNAGTQIVRRSSNSVGSLIQFGITNDAGAALRVDFEVIASC